MNYSITAVKSLDRWERSDAKIAAHTEQSKARVRDLGKMLESLFKEAFVIMPDEDDYWILPSVKLGLDNKGNYDYITLHITDNGFLRFCINIGYRKMEWKAVKMVHSGDVDLIDADKAQKAADAQVAVRDAYLANVRNQEAFVATRRAAEVEAFTKLRPQLEAAGVVFFSVGNGGGKILLTASVNGPQIRVIGDSCTLKLADYGHENMTVKPELIPAFVELFGRNAAALAASAIIG